MRPPSRKVLTGRFLKRHRAFIENRLLRSSLEESTMTVMENLHWNLGDDGTYVTIQSCRYKNTKV